MVLKTRNAELTFAGPSQTTLKITSTILLAAIKLARNGQDKQAKAAEKEAIYYAGVIRKIARLHGVA